MKPLILVGGGGHCKSVLEAAESAGYSILGVLDMPEEVGKEILSTKVIGTDDDIPAYVDIAEFVITVGFIKNPAIRIILYNKIKEAGGKLATVVASTAYVSKYAEIGEGTVVLHQAFVNAGAKVAAEYEAFFKNVPNIEFFVDSPDTFSNYWLNVVILKDKNAQQDFLQYTNDNGVMTRPIWELMCRLPMFENCENDGLKNTIWFADRVVNIPSSVRIKA